MKNFIILLMLCITIDGFAQNGYVNGYVVKNDGDTLRGQIYFPGWDVTPKQIRFRQGTAEQELLVSQLKSFSISGIDNYTREFIVLDASPISDNNLLSVDSSILQKDTIFLRVVVNGTASLYYYHGPDQKEHFFIGKNNAVNELIYHRYKMMKNGNEYIQENKKFIGQLTYYMSDCPEIQNGYNNLKYTENSLKALFITYDNCKGSTSTFIAKRNGVSARLGVVAGVSLSNVTITGEEFSNIQDAVFNTCISPVMGIKLDFYFIPKNKNFSLYSDLELQPISFTGTGNTSSGIFSFNKTYKISTDYLFLNTMFRYYFGQNDWKPFINAGVQEAAFLVKTNNDSLVTVETAPSGKTTTRQKLFDLPGRSAGIEFGGGVMW